MQQQCVSTLMYVISTSSTICQLSLDDRGRLNISIRRASGRLTAFSAFAVMLPLPGRVCHLLVRFHQIKSGVNKGNMGKPLWEIPDKPPADGIVFLREQ